MTFRTILVAVVALVISFATSSSVACAQTAPVTADEVAIARGHLLVAVDAAMPAVRCPPAAPSMIISIGDTTRVIGCGMTDGFEIALVEGIGSVLAELNAVRPRRETLELASAFADYLEAVAAARRLPPGELVFTPATVIARR